MKLLCFPSCLGMQEDSNAAEPHCWMKMPFNEQDICFRRQRLWANDCFSRRGKGQCLERPQIRTSQASCSQLAVCDRTACRTAPRDALSFLCMQLPAACLPAGRAGPCPVARRLEPVWAGLHLLELQLSSQSCHLIRCLLN